MKTIISIVLLSVAAVVFAGCGTSPTTTNMNANSMKNGNSMMNGNLKPNQTEMPMNHSNMSEMSDMKSDANATTAPYDLQFIDTMTAHHSGAIEMAKLVDGRTSNAEIIKFGKQIIADQEKEIAQMKDWREKWFAGKPAAKNMEMPGMMDSMKMDMSKLSAAKDKDFDLMFLDMMTPHHAGAITMSKEALTKAEKSEIKTLANQIIKEQEAEIKKMSEWKMQWSK